jgi:hypothetical protein
VSPGRGNEALLDKITGYVKAEALKDGMTLAAWDLSIWRKRTKTRPVIQKVAR